MMKNIPKEFLDLLADETKSFVFLATSMADGSPQVTPVWFNTAGEYILINSARGRTKDRNMRARPQVALAIADPKNPYRYIQIRGKVVEITERGAREHINALSNKYTGNSVYPGNPDEVRVSYKIKIEKVHIMG
jgi:PPOX class probable F420-dependent enzyme